MKYTICGFQQSEMINLGFDSNDAILLRWVVDFFNTEKMTLKVQDDRVYFWVNYKTVTEELPILRITNTEIIARRFAKWESAGLIKKLLVKGADEFISNGRKGKRSGTFTYFTFDSDMLAVLLGDRLKSRALSEPSAAGVDFKVDPASTLGSGRDRLSGRPIDTSPKDSSAKDHSASAQSGEIIFSDDTWTYYSDGTAMLSDGSAKSISSMLNVPMEVMAWLDNQAIQPRKRT